jgi:hypothetical protein
VVNIQDLFDDTKCFDTIRGHAMAGRCDLPKMLVRLGHQKKAETRPSLFANATSAGALANASTTSPILASPVIICH